MGMRLFAVVRAFAIGAVFVSIWTWLVPSWFADGRPLEPDWNAAGIILIAVGGAVMVRCVWDFAWTGRGTPAPFDPPRRLVIKGLYRFVRNPMYVGMGLALAGEALVLPQIRREMLILIVVLWGVVTLFILFYEEPALRRLFGAEYVEYCRNVRRWIPRLRPFDKPEAAAVRSPDLE
jgi:protein-S-isoprenylcysteine O-methyltransferase Ste14